MDSSPLDGLAVRGPNSVRKLIRLAAAAAATIEGGVSSHTKANSGPQRQSLEGQLWCAQQLCRSAGAAHRKAVAFGTSSPASAAAASSVAGRLADCLSWKCRRFSASMKSWHHHRHPVTPHTRSLWLWHVVRGGGGGSAVPPAFRTARPTAASSASRPAATAPSRRRDCHFADTPCSSLWKHLLKVQGGAIK